MSLARLAGGVLGCSLLCGAGCSDNDDDYGMLGGGIDAGTNIDSGLAADGAVDASLDGGLDASFTAGTSPLTSFFVSSDTSATGNLGGLAGADARCLRLATAVGLGAKTWRAFLSVESDPGNGGMPTHAPTRIGTGPWYNARGVLLASNLGMLLSLSGDAELFLDERGQKVNGQWGGSPLPIEHDVLTGTYSDGGVAAGKTCGDWTSAAPAPAVAIVGHSDGLGPMMDSVPPRNSWFSAHENGSCGDTTPRGGSGRIYCFAAN